MPPDAKLLSAEAVGPETVRLTFKDKITANKNNPLGGVVFDGPIGSSETDLDICDKGKDWIEVDTLGRQFDHVQMLGPVTHLWGASGSVATGYGMAIERPPVVDITNVELKPVPSEIHFDFSALISSFGIPSGIDARAPDAAWRGLVNKSGSGPDWQELLWVWGVPLPTQWRVQTYPNNIVFADGWLNVPISGSILPMAGGLIDHVSYVPPNDIYWHWAGGDQTACAGLPPELQVWAPVVGWTAPTVLFFWDANRSDYVYNFAGQTPTIWRLNAQPAGSVFASGVLSIPQNGSLVP